MPQTDTQPRPRIGLALSGGGFRAMLFHIGVVCALKESNLLGNVRAISAASGGSILAAHMVLKWPEYLKTNPAPATGPLSSDVPFPMSVIEPLIHLAHERDLRGQMQGKYPRWALHLCLTVLRHPLTMLLGLPPSDRCIRALRRHSPAAMLRDELERVFQRAILGRLSTKTGTKRADVPAPPSLSIVGCNLTSGTMCEFNENGYVEDIMNQPHENCRSGENIEIRDAVAASSSFPIFVWPSLIEHRTPSGDTKFHYVSDGGICDNLGLGSFLLPERTKELDFLIVSDGTGAVRKDTSTRLGCLPFATIRQLEIGQRVNQLFQAFGAQAIATILHPETRDGCKLIAASIDTRTNVPYTNDIVNCIRQLRTDLNIFSRKEIEALITHGYHVGRGTCAEVLRSTGSQTTPPECRAGAFGNVNQYWWVPRPSGGAPENEKLLKALQAGAVRPALPSRHRPRVMLLVGTACWIVFLILMMPPAIVLVFVVLMLIVAPIATYSLIRATPTFLMNRFKSSDVAVS